MEAPASWALFSALLSLSACQPSFDDTPSLIARPRVLAVAAEPAEAKPGETVTLRTLVATPPGATAPSLDYAFCAERKPLTELGPIAPACLVPSSPSLISLGADPAPVAALPADGCRLFGPDRPPPKAGEPSGRPVDPDPSGGYFEPVRVRAVSADGDEYVSGGVRLACGLASVTQEQLLAFLAAYQRNANPAVDALLASGAPLGKASGPAPTHVPRGARVPLSLRFSACPRAASCGDGVCSPGEDKASCAADCQAPKGCTGAESYIWYDAENPRLAVRREALRVSWFASAGSFAEEHTGQGEYDADGTESLNSWQAPASAGEVRLWVVLRDDRGGTGWEEFTLTVD